MQDKISAKEQCEKLARQIWEDYCPNDSDDRLVIGGDLDKDYSNTRLGTKVCLRYMTQDENFDLDYIVDKIVRISTENGNPHLFLNMTNGNKVFTCGLGIVAHMLGASLYYVDKETRTDQDCVRLLKDCEAPAIDKLGKTEKDILRAIGEIYALHERPDDLSSAPVSHESYIGSRNRYPIDSIEPNVDIKTGEAQLSKTKNDPDFYIFQSKITEYTDQKWEKGISRSLVSANIHKLADKKLINILDAKTKAGKDSNKWNAIQLTVRGRLVLSKL